jgi:hypothetical protein
MGTYTPVGSFVLAPGDILVKRAYEKDPVSHVIRAAQAVVKGTKYANYVHAAIALDAETVAEATGDGVAKNKLSNNLKQGYHYKVFRYTAEPEIAEAAAEWALSQVERKPKYSTGKAFTSLFKKSGPKSGDRMGLLGEASLFCSEFTTECYNRVAYEQGKGAIFPFEADAANPSTLYGYLKHSTNWENLGDLP